MMTVQTNIVGINANRNANKHQSAMSKALLRLSSGLRINSAADDPSGLCMTQKMRAKLSGLEATQENTLDALSKAQTIDGVLGEIQSMAQRMNELAVKASNSTLDEHDRLNIDKEYQELLKEIERQSNTGYNGNTILNNGASTVSDNSSKSAEFVATGNNIGAFMDGLNDFLRQVSQAEKAGDNKKLDELGVSTDKSVSNIQRMNEAVKIFTEKNADKLLNQPLGKGEAEYTVSIKNGALDIKCTNLSKNMYGLQGTSLKTVDDALSAITKVKDAINKISTQRADQAAEINRINETLNNIETMKINLTDSLSKIVDADMAKEMMNYTKEQILLQASNFVMAHSTGTMKNTASFLQDMIKE